MEHTKEPWRIDRDDRPDMEWNNHIVSEAEPHLTICFMSHDGTPENTTGEANARRIVACVNALAGFTTEEIEAGVDLVKLKRQRDDLLAAQEGIKKAAYYDGYTERETEVRDAIQALEDAVSIFGPEPEQPCLAPKWYERATAAIAKVKP